MTLYKCLLKFYGEGKIPLTQAQRLALGSIVAKKFHESYPDEKMVYCKSFEDIGDFDRVLSYPKKYAYLINTVVREYDAANFKPLLPPVKKQRKRIPLKSVKINLDR